MAPTSASPIGQAITLDDGRRAWIRVSRSAARLEGRGHQWHRWVVDEQGRRIASASYEAHAPGTVHASVWVPHAWRSVGLGRRLFEMLTSAAEHHQVRWVTFDYSRSDTSARRLLARCGSIVARRNRGNDIRAAVLLADPRPTVHASAERTVAKAA